METSDLNKFKALLQEQEKNLSDMSATLDEAGQTVELDQTRVGRLSRMDALQNQQMALESERRRKQKLVAIAAALRRIDAGDYGMCAHCDEHINPRRLEADPTNTLCIECASNTQIKDQG